MGAVKAAAERWSAGRQSIYEFRVNDGDGRVYLERRRSPFWGELPFVIGLIAAVIFALGSYCGYIRLQTEIECRIDRTESLQREYLSLKNENGILERTLAQTPDFSQIYKIATEELGMVPVTRDNIVLYRRSNSEFVYQRENIPIFGYQ